MASYRVFLGAPTRAELTNEASFYRWTTTSSRNNTTIIPRTRTIPLSQPLVLPTATLEAASARISLIYKDIIFDDDSDDDGLGFSENLAEQEQVQTSILAPFGGEQTTLYTWPPTGEEGTETNPIDKTSNLRLTNNVTSNRTMDITGDTDPSFFKSLYTTKSFSLEGDSIEYPRRDQNQMGAETQLFETQESQSFGNYSDASSIGRFPTYHFSLHSITSLGQLATSGFKGSRKINVLLAVLEVEGPDTIRIKKGVDAGRDVSILKLILGDDVGQVCKLTAWREVAETWGGTVKAVGIKRGDIVYIENVTVACAPSASMTLTASPNLQPQLTICYRTMPYTHEDGRLRPDLRLGEGEPTIRRVSAIVQWFEHMAGLV